MEIKPGQHVKILFNDGMVEEGIIEKWSDGKSAIRNIKGTSVLIIMRTLQDVKAVQIILDKEPKHEPAKPDHKEPVYVEESYKPDKYYAKENLRALKLAELHHLRAEEERQRARRKLTTFEPTFTPKITYDAQRATIPARIQPIPQHTNQEIRSTKRYPQKTSKRPRRMR